MIAPAPGIGSLMTEPRRRGARSGAGGRRGRRRRRSVCGPRRRAARPLEGTPARHGRARSVGGDHECRPGDRRATADALAAHADHGVGDRAVEDVGRPLLRTGADVGVLRRSVGRDREAQQDEGGELCGAHAGTVELPRGPFVGNRLALRGNVSGGYIRLRGRGCRATRRGSSRPGRDASRTGWAPAEPGDRQPRAGRATLAQRRAADRSAVGRQPTVDGAPDPAVYVADIRRRLADERDALSASGSGYVLSIARDEVDLFVFVDPSSGPRPVWTPTRPPWRRRCRRRSSHGRPHWTGCGPRWPSRPCSRRYEALRLEALETLNGVELGSDAARAVGRLETLVREHPTRERFWAQLIGGLAVLGRRDAALQACQRVARRCASISASGPGACCSMSSATCSTARRRRSRRIRARRRPACRRPCRRSSVVTPRSPPSSRHRGAPARDVARPGWMRQDAVGLAVGAAGVDRHCDGTGLSISLRCPRTQRWALRRASAGRRGRPRRAPCRARTPRSW